MRRRKQRKADQAEVNMTPMLDIVFILLIFFIVTATFLQEEGINMQPPPPSDEVTEPSPLILVQIDQNNRVFVNQLPSDPARVLAAVSRFRAEDPRSAVLITPNDLADHGIIVQIWDDMRANNIPVSLRREQAAGGS